MVRPKWMYLLLALVGMALPIPVTASDPAVGIVLLHGKWDTSPGHVSGLANYLKREGFLVETPEMPWSGRREYDKDFAAAMAEIDEAIAALRKAGANKIIVGGHSMGANAALHYAGRTKVDGVLVMAPGHFAEGRKTQEFVGDSVTKAREMVAAGKGSETARFEDFNTGNRRKTVKCPAASYLSYFDPTGPMNAHKNATSLKPDTPVLWIVGKKEEPGAKGIGSAVHDLLAPMAASRYVEVDADHLNTPDASKAVVVDWLKSFKN